MTDILTIDALWFKAHPERQYRLRRQTPAEGATWPVPPRKGRQPWCVIRRSDGATEVFAISERKGWCSCEGCAKSLFDDLREDAA